jgi:hypothetical protein
VNILFAVERRIDAGSIQALAHYARIGRQFGHTFSIYGSHDPRLPEMVFSTDVTAFDYVVFIFESKLDWISGLDLVRLLTLVPKSRRVILDADGMYNPVLILDGYDRNHASERERTRWAACYEVLADRVLQPTFSPRQPAVQPLLFYGYDPHAALRSADAKRVHIMHLGHNWWRWREVSERLLPAVRRVRQDLGDICFVGLWWDAPPPWATALGQEAAFRVEPGRLEELSIHTFPAVPYRDVLATMSTAHINIMTQRPLFHELRLVTSKYFEIFAADTIPLVMLEPRHAEQIYGPAVRDLVLDGDIGGKLVDVLRNPNKYQARVHAVRAHLAAHHSYEQRLHELLATLDGQWTESTGELSCA